MQVRLTLAEYLISLYSSYLGFSSNLVRSMMSIILPLGSANEAHLPYCTSKGSISTL